MKMLKCKNIVLHRSIPVSIMWLNWLCATDLPEIGLDED